MSDSSRRCDEHGKKLRLEPAGEKAVSWRVYCLYCGRYYARVSDDQRKNLVKHGVLVNAK